MEQENKDALMTPGAVQAYLAGLTHRSPLLAWAKKTVPPYLRTLAEPVETKPQFKPYATKKSLKAKAPTVPIKPLKIAKPAPIEFWPPSTVELGRIEGPERPPVPKPKFKPPKPPEPRPKEKKKGRRMFSEHIRLLWDLRNEQACSNCVR